jgi:hypothetical protein
LENKENKNMAKCKHYETCIPRKHAEIAYGEKDKKGTLESWDIEDSKRKAYLCSHDGRGPEGNLCGILDLAD